jgi:DNA replication and repair protein RecF
MLTELSLRQFRCHQELTWRPGSGWNLLLGHNGQGKTSILEAIYYLSRMRSHRSSTTRELIQWGQEGFALHAHHGATPLRELFVRWEKKQKTYQVDGITIERLDQFWGQLPVVLISAEDIEILRGPALKRQQWLDSLIAHETPAHLTLLQKYNAVLQQRNAALKNRLWEKRLHDVLCQQLTDYGRQIVFARITLTLKLKDPLDQVSGRLGQNEKKLLFQYQPNVEPQENHLGIAFVPKNKTSVAHF